MSTLSKDPQRIQSMFSQVAHGYDRANTILSGGIHHWWRTLLVRWAAPKPKERILDCATGTGDLALKFKRTEPTTTVIGTDFCDPMLDKARLKDPTSSVTFQWADTMKLPFADSSFDLVTISFGIRNVADPVKGLSEMHRVLRPGGRLLVLEFGQPSGALWGSLYRFYSEKVLPEIGGLVTGQRSAYKYLQDSSAEFPCREDFLSLMDRAGAWSAKEFRPLTGGIAYIYKAVKASQ